MFQFFIFLLGYSHCKILQVISISLFMSLAEIYFSLFFLGIKEMPLELKYWWSRGTFLYFIVSVVIWAYWIFFPLVSKCPFHFSLFLSLSYFSFFSKYQAEIGYTKSEPQFIVPWEVYKLGISGKKLYILLENI